MSPNATAPGAGSDGVADSGAGGSALWQRPALRTAAFLLLVVIAVGMWVVLGLRAKTMCLQRRRLRQRSWL